MLYLIGGGARCGKSILAKKLLTQLPNAAYLSGDSFRHAVRPLLPHGQSATKTTEQYIKYYHDHTNQAIANALLRAQTLWPLIEHYIDAYFLETKSDFIVESIDIWPELLSTLTIPHKAVFLVDTTIEQ